MLFAVYVNDVTETLRASRLGCFAGDIRCIAYADELILPSASLTVLQLLQDMIYRGVAGAAAPKITSCLCHTYT